MAMGILESRNEHRRRPLSPNPRGKAVAHAESNFLSVGRSDFQPIEEEPMKKNESIDKVLSREVVTTHLGQSVSDVRKLLAKNGFHHMPVVSGRLRTNMRPRRCCSKLSAR